MSCDPVWMGIDNMRNNNTSKALDTLPESPILWHGIMIAAGRQGWIFLNPCNDFLEYDALWAGHTRLYPSQRYQGVPGIPCRTIFEVREEILISLRNIHLWPLIHYRTVCSEFSGYDTLCVRHNETGTCGPQQHSHLDLAKGSTDGLLPSTPNSVQRLHW